MQSRRDIDSSCHPQTSSTGGTLGLELDEKEGMYRVLTVGDHLSPHRENWICCASVNALRLYP